MPTSNDNNIIWPQLLAKALPGTWKTLICYDLLIICCLFADSVFFLFWPQASGFSRRSWHAGSAWFSRRSWPRWVCNPSKLQWDSAGLLSRPCISALTGWMPYQLRIWHVLCCSLGASIEGSNRIILLYPAMRSVLWQASLLDRPARVKVRPNILQLAVQLTGEGFCLRHSASLLTPDISWHLLTSLDWSRVRSCGGLLRRLTLRLGSEQSWFQLFRKRRQDAARFNGFQWYKLVQNASDNSENSKMANDTKWPKMDFVRVQAAARKSLAANQQAVWKRSDVGIYIYIRI